MQNTQKEYASLFLILHICHTFLIHASLFYEDYSLMLYVQFLQFLISKWWNIFLPTSISFPLIS